MKNLFDTVIIGAGPAGISASLYIKRANFNVLVLYSGESALEKAHKIDNYYGFTEGIKGSDLFKNGIRQAENLGISVKKEEVTEILLNEDFSFRIVTDAGTYSAKTVIIATGNKKLRPDIKGLLEHEGKGVSYCAVCDTFFYRKKDVAVIGDGKFAVSEAENIENTASSTTILTNGKDSTTVINILKEKKLETGIKVNSRKITEIAGDGKSPAVSKVVFEDGSELSVSGVFIALGQAGAADFAKKIGMELKGDSIYVNEKMQTNIPGLFSCGDAAGNLLQVSKAVYEGAKAGLSAVEFIREKNRNQI